MMTAALARRLGCTEGQVYTLATALVVAGVLAWSGISPLPDDSFGGFLASPRGSQVTRTAGSASPPALNTAPSPPASVALPFGGSTSFGDTGTSTAAATAPSAGPEGPMTFAEVGSPGAPGGLAVAADGRVFVVTDNGTARGIAGPSHLFEFSPSGALTSDEVVTGQPADHAGGLTGVAVDRDGSVYAVDGSTGRILRIDLARGSQAVVATVPDVKPCLFGIAAVPCEPGVTDHLRVTGAATLDRDGALFVTDSGQGTIWRWRPGDKEPSAWYQSADLATGDGPSGIALDADGSVLFTAGTTLDISNPNGGGLYRLVRNADGSTGSRSLVATFAPADRPGAVAVGPTGVAYVVVRKTGTVVTIDHGAKTPLPADGSPVPLDTPSALAVVGNRLLVANGSSSKDASRWVVLSLPL